MAQALKTKTENTGQPDPAAKRKRRFGDRYDGRRLRSMDPLNALIPFVMNTRAGSTNFFSAKMDIRAAEHFIRQKRVEGLKGFGMLHFFLASYVRIVSQRPGINRFVSGQRLYARHKIEINVTVKKDLSVTGQETTIKICCLPGDTAADIYHHVEEALLEGRRAGDSNSTDFAARMFSHMPRALLKFVVWLFKSMDYFGLMPRSIHKASPFHGSLFVADLGSISLPPVHHHLYEFGHCPLFLAFGPKEKRYVPNKDGEVTEQRTVEFSLSLDERICDGFYFSGVFRMLNDCFKNPSQLDLPPAQVVEDIE